MLEFNSVISYEVCRGVFGPIHEQNSFCKVFPNFPFTSTSRLSKPNGCKFAIDICLQRESFPIKKKRMGFSGFSKNKLE